MSSALNSRNTQYTESPLAADHACMNRDALRVRVAVHPPAAQNRASGGKHLTMLSVYAQRAADAAPVRPGGAGAQRIRCRGRLRSWVRVEAGPGWGISCLDSGGESVVGRTYRCAAA